MSDLKIITQLEGLLGEKFKKVRLNDMKRYWGESKVVYGIFKTK